MQGVYFGTVPVLAIAALIDLVKNPYSSLVRCHILCISMVKEKTKADTAVMGSLWHVMVSVVHVISAVRGRVLAHSQAALYITF